MAAPYSRDMHIEIDQLSVTGHVVFAGRDGLVKVQTGGNVAQNTRQTICIGGIETTQQAYQQMLGEIRRVEEAVKQARLLPESKEAAQHDLQTVKAQLTTPKKPNQRILVRAAKSLLRYSPALTAAALTLFDQPLVGTIVGSAGEIAASFHDLISQRSASKDS
ncbi:MAG: hypothetical protein OXF90_08535 [Chloroflexi bacterium]|nr:hypothetical protein [Chloroflexota bacterium]